MQPTPEKETPGIEGSNPSRREWRRMRGERGLESRLSFLPCPPAEHMAGSGGKLELFWSREELSRPSQKGLSCKRLF